MARRQQQNLCRRQECPVREITGNLPVFPVAIPFVEQASRLPLGLQAGRLLHNLKPNYYGFSGGRIINPNGANCETPPICTWP
jgi:hypothetical protein